MALWQRTLDTLRACPALGYGRPYAIGNPLLTIFGMVIVPMPAGSS